MMLPTMMLLVLSPIQAQEAGEQIRRWVEANVAGHERITGQISPVPLGGLDAFVGGRTYSVHFREYPVAMIPPEPLSARNVFWLGGTGKVRLFATPGALSKFVCSLHRPVRAEKEMRQLLAGWLEASEVYSQDGFFKFSIPASKLKVDLRSGKASGVAAVEPKGGDRGEIRANLVFKKRGSAWMLDSIKETRTVQAGVRPICQATKLLDPDPIVRRMAERDILVMGRSARPYLLEQRAKASPKLQAAIDRIWKRVLAGER